MQQRIFILSATIATIFMAVVLLVGLRAVATAGDSGFTQEAAGDAALVPEIIARRAISIPFGIDSPLPTADGGEQVLVSGHGECQAGGETVKLLVTVRQGQAASMAHARGQVEVDCADAEAWSLVAHALGPRTFTAGPAEVCALAIVKLPQGGNWVNQWCVEVTLVE